MDERKYDVVVHSIWRYFLAMFSLFFLIALTALKFMKGTPFLLVGIFILLNYLISCEVAHWLSKGKVRIIMSQHGFKQIWLKSFVFGTKEGFSISWKDIKSFEFCSAAGYGMDNFGPFFDRFFLELTNKRRYFLNRAVFLYQAKDDFKTFLEEFETVSNSFKTGSNNLSETNLIAYKETRYDLVYRGVSIFSLLVLVFFSWMKFSGQIKQMSWWVLVIIALFALFYGKKGFRSK